MSRSNFLKTIILVSIAAVIILPTYVILVLEPSYINFITTSTEKEAIKVGTHMSNLFFDNGKTVAKENLPSQIDKEMHHLQEEFHIIKVKIFSPSGEIIFSTYPSDIGQINKKSYFHNEVTSGKPYTKVVQKNTKTLEGQTMSVDVVETYVPIMRGPNFAGAFEIYYDITQSKQELHNLLLQSKQSSFGIALALLLAVIITAVQSYQSIQSQNEAEANLQRANDELDMRVIERTAQLHETNSSLQQEIIVRKETEKEKEELIVELQNAIEQVKTLRGLLPICASCQKIRDKQGKWNKVDEYIQENTEAELTHGICPQCAEELYPDIYKDNVKDKA